MSVTALGLVPEWNVADRLRKARQSVGKTQREFAAMLDVSEQAYGQWEADNNKPRDLIGIAQRVQAVTGVSAAWIVGLDSGPEIGPGAPKLPHLDSNQEPCGFWSGGIPFGFPSAA